jgi:hypothetical protein
MSAPPPARLPSRVLILILLALLILVALGRLLFGLPDFLLYGLAGGLIFCLLIIGRDRLLAAQRRLDSGQEAYRGDNDGRDDDHSTSDR